MDGTMRSRCKSDFNDVILELFPDMNILETSHNCLSHNFEIIVHFF